MAVNKIVWVTWKSNIENKIMSVPGRIQSKIRFKVKSRSTQEF